MNKLSKKKSYCRMTVREAEEVANSLSASKAIAELYKYFSLQRKLMRGLGLTYPESVTLIQAYVHWITENEPMSVWRLSVMWDNGNEPTQNIRNRVRRLSERGLIGEVSKNGYTPLYAPTLEAIRELQGLAG